MLDADEAAGFDESMRQDPELRNAWRKMNCLSAAIAAATVTPIAPRPGQLERLQTRLGLNASRSTNWPAITGWAAAAALTLILVLDDRAQISTSRNDLAATPTTRGTTPAVAPSLIEAPAGDVTAPPEKNVSTPPPESSRIAAAQENEIRTIAKVETKRLIQEIEVLREKLEGAQKRDQRRFEAVPGMSWPIVMTMGPPLADNAKGEAVFAMVGDGPTLTNVIGDALAGNGYIPPFEPSGKSTTPTVAPSAIPIYDAARDVGTLVTNLPRTNADEPYILWVQTENSDTPVLVGQLPASDVPGADSFDFSLGKTAVVPTGFILTKGAEGKAEPPSSSNTVLLGPR